MIKKVLLIALFISSFVSANESAIETVKIGNLVISELDNKINISFNNYSILELDNQVCGLCGGTYILHSPNKEDVEWIEAGHPLVDDKVLSGVDLRNITPYINPDNSRKIIGFFQAGAGASGRAGGNTSYHIDIESGEILQNSYTYDNYQTFLGFPWPFEETVIKKIKPKSAK